MDETRTSPKNMIVAFAAAAVLAVAAWMSVAGSAVSTDTAGKSTSGTSWRNLDKNGTSWRNLDKNGTSWRNLGTNGTSWR